MKKIFKATKSNYFKLVKKGFNPLHKTYVISSSVKYFLIFEKENTFIFLNKKPNL